MRRRFVFTILLLLILSRSGTGFFLQPNELALPSPGAAPLYGELASLEDGALFIGVLDMAVIQQAHPLWESPLRMGEELHYFYRQLQEEEKSYELVELEVARQREELGKKKEARLARINEEYQAEVQKKQQALQEELKHLEEQAWREFEEDLQAERERLDVVAAQRVSSRFAGEKEEYERFVEELLVEFKPLILNLRLKLLVLNLLPEEKEALEEEIHSLEEDLERQRTLRREELDSLMEEYRSFVEGQVEAEFLDYERRGQWDLEEVLRLLRRRMEQELEDAIQRRNRQLQLDLAHEREQLVEEEEKKLLQLEGTIRGEIKGRILFLTQEIQRLEEARDSLYEEMEKEIREIVSILAQDQGLDVVLTVPIDGLDITSMVVEKLQ